MLTLSAPLGYPNRWRFHRAAQRAQRLALHGVTPIGFPLGEEDASSVLIPPRTMAGIVWSLLSTAGVAASAYHGYKRHDSIGWAVLWAIAGGLIPIVTVPVALAQGFGKKAH